MIPNEEEIAFILSGSPKSVNCTKVFLEVFINMFANLCKKWNFLPWSRAPCWPQINKSHEPSTHYPYFSFCPLMKLSGQKKNKRKQVGRKSIWVCLAIKSHLKKLLKIHLSVAKDRKIAKLFFFLCYIVIINPFAET